MVDKSIIFDFSRVPNFMDDYNIEFLVADMDGSTKNYEFIMSDSCPNNIEDCLTNNGGLNTTAVHTIDIGNDGDVALSYSVGAENSRVISLGSSAVTIDVGDVDLNLKAVFLCDKSSGYVMAYTILARTIPITNEVVLPASGMVWNIRNE